MFRRSLLTFLGLVFLVLVMIVAYAAVRWSGPDTVVRQAEELYAAGAFTECIRKLDLADRELGPTPSAELGRRILRLRYRAHLEVQNFPLALRDLRRLRGFDPGDEALAEAEVYWTLRSGALEQGLDLARAHLAERPTDGRAHELVGEAFQALYQHEIAALFDELERELGRDTRRDAVTALKSWLYRDPLDPRGRAGRAEFDALLKTNHRAAFTTGKFDARLAQIHGRVQDALAHYRKALELGGQPVAAYQGLSFALRQGERDDELFALAEIYLARFDHAYTAEAAADLAELHHRNERYTAALEICDRYLPPGTWPERLAAGTIDGSIRRVVLAKARTLHALADAEALQAHAEEAMAMHESDELNLAPDIRLIAALDRMTRGRAKDAVAALGYYDSALSRYPPTESTNARRIEGLRLRLGLRADAELSEADVLAMFDTWAHLAPSDPDVPLARAEFLLEIGKNSAAMSAAEYARELDRHREDALRVYAEAADRNFAKSSRGTDDMLARALALRRSLPPEIADGALLLPLGEKALAQGHPHITAACAARATQLFNWSIWPRHLAMRAGLARARPEDVVRVADTTLTYHPGDRESLLALRRARRMLGVHDDSMLYELLLADERDAEIAQALIQASIARQNVAQARMLGGVVAKHYGDEPQALFDASYVDLLSGDTESSIKKLLRCAELAHGKDDELAARAFGRYFLFRAPTADPAELRGLFEQTMKFHAGNADELTTLAEGLGGFGLFELARRVLDPILVEDRYRDQRSGRHYLLAGRYSLELAREREAERELHQAMGFEDGEAASRPLTILLLERGLEQEARESWWEPEVTDLTSACIAVRTNRVKDATTWVDSALTENPLDGPAACLNGLLRPSQAQTPSIAALATANPDELLRVLLLLQAEGFGNAARAAAADLVEAHPDNDYAKYLAALASENAGDPQTAFKLLQEILETDRAREKGKLPFLGAYDAAIRLLDKHGFALGQGPTVLQQVTRPVTEDRVSTPRMLALATRNYAMQMVAQVGKAGDALAMLARSWIDNPVGSRAGLSEVLLLAAAGPDRRADAFALLDAIESTIDPKLRESWIDTYFGIVTTTLAEGPDPKLERAAEARGLTILQDEFAHGSAVHFLVQLDERRFGPFAAGDRVDAERAGRVRGWVEAHIDDCEHNKRGAANLLETSFLTLSTVAGRDVAMARLERFLDRDPSVVPLWVVRARWLVDDGRPDEGVDGLRWIGHYLPRSPSILGAVEVMAAAGRTIPESTLAVLRGLPPRVAGSKDGKLSFGLIALRSGRYVEAGVLLGGGSPRPEGSTRYARALAALASGDPHTAAKLFARVAKDHGATLQGKEAAHFAAQLEHLGPPRTAQAAPAANGQDG